MILKMLSEETRGFSGQNVKPAPFKPESVIGCNIIDFEVAKWALDQGGKPEGKKRRGMQDFSQLPNLAAEDWFEWTALCALFGAVALFPFLAMVLFR